MRMSNAKMNFLSRKVMDTLIDSEAIDYTVEPNEIRLRIKSIFETEVKLDDEVDEAVRATLESYSKNRLHEGSREWDVEYDRLYEKEMEKRRRG